MFRGASAHTHSVPIRDGMLHEGRPQLFFSVASVGHICMADGKRCRHLDSWPSCGLPHFLTRPLHTRFVSTMSLMVGARGGHSRCSHKNEMFISMEIPPSAMITITFTGMMATRRYSVHVLMCIYGTCNTHIKAIAMLVVSAPVSLGSNVCKWRKGQNAQSACVCEREWMVWTCMR